ncbi:DDE-domain-containing protein [Zopfia rhizophila CBS 207.26]|uniref:DDE-domain-containing protein n=1 Tax=Zopfia rhizophila CBS 207.26 TaxID=1314779 RepID=A0A6A6DCP9_9PEZI|nr:DDE-domain-containing protein [Zopfia rhizophila CBS 207.26]
MPRTGVSQAERKALRQFYYSQNPYPRHKACISWFQQKFSRKLGQSTISESLSDNFKYLDDADADALSSHFRNRQTSWPILESILFSWQQKIEYKGGLEHISHGEVASVPIGAEMEMQEVRNVCRQYPDEDIHNMNETGLYWRWAIPKGLSTAAHPGVKKYKSRISLGFCVNATGTDKLPPWLIGKSKVPHALRGVNIEALGTVWKASKKRWINSKIMGDWLKAFYRHIGHQRRILLLLDNFSAHIIGLEIAPPPANIRILLLPKNSTSMYQPLDQGIIQNFKTMYKNQWLAFTIEQYDNGKDPIQLVTLYHTLRWCMRAWIYEVTPSSIYNCFRKSTVVRAVGEGSIVREPAEDLTNLLIAAQMAGNVQAQDARDTDDFVHPADEDFEVEEEASPQDIVDHHTGQTGQEVAPEEDDTVEPPPSVQQALEAIQLLLRYKEHQESVGREELHNLMRMERDLSLTAVKHQKQSTLDSWLG